jgi:DNA topoisomerase-1
LAAIGRFGPYLKYKGAFTTIPKGHDPHSITLDEAMALIQEKKVRDASKILRSYSEDAKLQVLSGRYGPYIVYDKKNYKLPKGTAPEGLSFEAAMAIVKGAPERTTRGRGKTARGRGK